MSYIESHQELGRHPKTKRLARLLSVSLPCAVGHLQFLWWWAMDYAQDGDLTKFDAFDIADAAGWDGDPDAFLLALQECGIGEGYGFIECHEDGTLLLHDWQDYGGKLFTERKKNAEKQARYRDQKATAPSENVPEKSRNRNVTVTSPVTLKERRGEKSISSPPTPNESEADTTTTNEPRAFSYPDKLPYRVQEMLDQQCPPWYEQHLRLALTGRSPGGLASYALEILRGWRSGKNAPQGPLPEAPQALTSPGEYFDPNEAERKRRMALARANGTFPNRTLEALAPGERSRPN